MDCQPVGEEGRAVYRHELHSIEREKLYRELAPTVSSAFDALHKTPKQSPEEQQKRFEDIENI